MKKLDLKTDFLSTNDDVEVTKYCNNCSRLIEANSSFCTDCGSPVDISLTQNESNVYKAKKTTDNKPSGEFKDWIMRYSKFFIILVIVIVIIIIAASDDSDSNYVSENNKNINTPTYVKPPANIRSLTNGFTVDSLSYYLNGEGELTIENGTTNDAVIKLVSTRTNKSIITFYVKKNNNFTVTGISDGNYKVIVAQGNDWDSYLKEFTLKPSFFEFEDIFDFKTTSQEYSIWELSLRSVVGGNADTDTVSENTFNNY